MGFRKQLNWDGLCRDGFVGMISNAWGDHGMLHGGPRELVCSSGAVLNMDIAGEQVYFDDLTGQPLNAALVRDTPE